MRSPIFVHIGDVHLQSGHPRNADRLQALDQIIDEGLQFDRLGAWLIPGDIFHSRSSAVDRNDFAARAIRMGAKAPICLCRGNHDQPGDLDIFAQLKTTWPIYVVTRPTVLQVPLATGDTAAIATLPYPDKVGLVAGGVAPGDVGMTAGQLLDVICMQLAHDLSTLRVGGCVPLFMGHANIKGAIASTGQPQIGQEIEVDVAMLERLPVVYCALSHIHKPQEVGRGVFAGSIAAMDHGESEAKSYVVVEATRGAAGWEATWTRRPIHTPPMFHVDGELTREGFRLAEGSDAEVERRYHAGDWSGTDLRVRYTYRASERSVISEVTVRELFAGALRLKVEGVAIADRELRAPAVAAAKTLPEKLAAYRQVAQLEPSVASKLTLLQQADAAAVLAAVADALAAIEQPEKALVAA